MTLDEFKSIYWFEYGHRMLGRFIGAFVLIPGSYFLMRGYVTPNIRNRMFLITALIGWQGLLGWYMVKSGLDDKIIEDKQVPRVSQYRLAAHLGSAFIIYITAVTTGLGILASLRTPSVAAVQASKLLAQTASFKNFKTYTHATAGLIFVTAVSGAFVAGLDAGLIYNSFPKMGGLWIPSDMWALSPTWKNVFENPTTVQFNHRYLAMGTFTAIVALWFASRRLPLPPNIKFGVNTLLGVASLQVTLGVSTLLWLVPVPLAAAHQGGSLTLLTVALWLINALKHVPK